MRYLVILPPEQGKSFFANEYEYIDGATVYDLIDYQVYDGETWEDVNVNECRCLACQLGDPEACLEKELNTH